jgi:hypothetical protein
MALASSVLMFAGSPQMFLGVATAQESLSILIDILPTYARYVRSDLEQTLIGLSSFIAKPFAKLGVRFSTSKRAEPSCTGMHLALRFPTAQSGRSGVRRGHLPENEGDPAGLCRYPGTRRLAGHTGRRQACAAANPAMKMAFTVNPLS